MIYHTKPHTGICRPSTLHPQDYRLSHHGSFTSTLCLNQSHQHLMNFSNAQLSSQGSQDALTVLKTIVILRCFTDRVFLTWLHNLLCDCHQTLLVPTITQAHIGPLNRIATPPVQLSSYVDPASLERMATGTSMVSEVPNAVSEDITMTDTWQQQALQRSLLLDLAPHACQHHQLMPLMTATQS